MSARTTVIVPVRNHVSLTRQVIDSVREENPNVELVVVDDGSTDETPELLAERVDVRVVRHDESGGFAVSCNDGAAAASGDYLVFLNNDALGERGWLEALVDYADGNDAAGVVGARLLYQNGTIQHAGMVFGADLLPRHVYRGFPSDHPAVTRSRRFQAVTAACMLVRRTLFQELGGFDTEFTNGFDDVDLCLRAGEHGSEVHYCGASVLTHLEAATRGDDAALFKRNADRYFERWGGRVRRDDLEVYAEDGLLELAPGDLYPLALRVSPQLAALAEEDPYDVLDKRSNEVFDLLKQNASLRIQLVEESFEHGRQSSAGDVTTSGSEP